MTSLTVLPVPGHGAEDVVVATSGPDRGCVFTGTEDGAVFRVGPDGARVDRVAHTGGRPLGIEFAPDGRLLVCDAQRGLLWVDPASGRVELITADVEGRPMRFCNNAAIADDGTVWWSDSSTEYGIARWKDDFVQHTRTGRLLRRDPDGTVAVVLDGLAFANGVALSAAGDFVCVAETGARTVVRQWLTGERQGTRDFLVTDLPGYPDNIARGSDGLIWITIASPTDPLVERLQRGPMALRKLATRLPEALQPKPKQTVRVVAYDERGTLVHDLDLASSGPGAAYHMVTGVREHEGRVWLGSLHEPAIAFTDL
ncbi:SMP-30/gluconolactonase/LRE family protein [Nocardioides nitrophenolicus]|uniref:SMP-30/gluconolactonase/LRE family protein n=1 Tax=Nocardioides nitrophenolicus TaxID=60489 RepID=UPI00195CD43A|nr:SMP-30/gluconolactonase/LRE family protein [Nocardioides nitrophenolicus]MBM7515201.1 sugar lactone lactonase YvrE [Nocardioides nitrophenolicus]